jgi:hypothetical protein
MNIEHICKVKGEDILLGTVVIYGVHFHAEFLRVTTKNGEQVGTMDPHRRLDGYYAVGGEGAFHTVNVPGFKGEYVLCILPYQQ